VFALTFVPLLLFALYARSAGYRVGWLLIPVGILIILPLGYAVFQPWLHRRFHARRGR
jgi:hypothetical protein